MPQHRHHARAVNVHVAHLLERARREEMELRGALPLFDGRARDQHRVIGREVAAHHGRQRIEPPPRRERRRKLAHVPQLHRAVSRSTRQLPAVAVPPDARDVRANRVRAARHLARLDVGVLVLLPRRRGEHQLHRLVLGHAQLPQLQRTVLPAHHDRVAVGVPRTRRHGRLDALGVTWHRHQPLARVDIERRRVVAAIEADLDVPQAHRAVLARGRHRVLVGRVPARRGAASDVAARVAHVADVHVAFHHCAELAPVAVEKARLRRRPRDDHPVRGRAVVDGAQLVPAQRLLDVSKGPQLLRHPRKVPKVEVVVAGAGHEAATRAVEREARDALGVRLERDLVGDGQPGLLVVVVVVVAVAAAAHHLLAHVRRVVPLALGLRQLVEVAVVAHLRVHLLRRRQAWPRLRLVVIVIVVLLLLVVARIGCGGRRGLLRRLGRRGLGARPERSHRRREAGHRARRRQRGFGGGGAVGTARQPLHLHPLRLDHDGGAALDGRGEDALDLGQANPVGEELDPLFCRGAVARRQLPLALGRLDSHAVLGPLGLALPATYRDGLPQRDLRPLLLVLVCLRLRVVVRQHRCALDRPLLLARVCDDVEHKPAVLEGVSPRQPTRLRLLAEHARLEDRPLLGKPLGVGGGGVGGGGGRGDAVDV
mmetsp:Transcript_54074/g.160364  ORF Transcript_54074/g.160364 Transcript_54074/m.160364 type:complete len:653 (-) Transcript_54074:811-2769(-)